MYGIPFGSGGNDQFSGHKDDPESGLHYNLARSYNPAIARWISPDPIVGSAFDPQSLNKYGYNRTDPTNRLDPDGRWSPPLGSALPLLYSIDNMLMFMNGLLKMDYLMPTMPLITGDVRGGSGSAVTKR